MAKLNQLKDLKGFVVHVDNSWGRCLANRNGTMIYSWDVSEILVFKTKEEAQKAKSKVLTDIQSPISIVETKKVFGFDYSLSHRGLKKEIDHTKHCTSLKDLAKNAEYTAKDDLRDIDITVKYHQRELNRLKNESKKVKKELSFARKTLKQALKSKK